MDVTFDNLTYTVKTKKGDRDILKNVSGTFKSGELTAIMGPSGSGKTSLLNALTKFRVTGIKGNICNQDCTKDKSNQFKRNFCYILQENYLSDYLTVQEMMLMAADLKINVSKEQKQAVIDGILETMGLMYSKNTRCLNLSGGEKKKLSIALELIDNPAVIFLDEPTTGLDMSATLQCISMLKRIALDGCTVICTIHQSSATIYEMFDHVYVLADGLCVYRGSNENTVNFLKNFGFECPNFHNPADFLIEVVNGDYGNHNENFAKHVIEEDKTKPQKHKNTKKLKRKIESPSIAFIFWILLKRCFIQQHRDWSLLYIKLLIHLATGAGLGVFYYKSGSNGAQSFNNVGFLLISISHMAFTTLIPAILRFSQETLLVTKEIFNNWYKLWIYFAAVAISQLPIQILFSLTYAIISYLLTTQPTEIWRFFMFYIILIIIMLIAEALGHILGSIYNVIVSSIYMFHHNTFYEDTKEGIFVGSVICGIQIGFAGFMLQIPHMSKVMRTFSYVTFYRYGLEALVQTVYGYDRGVLECPSEEFYCHLRYPSKILKEFGMQNECYLRNTIILLFVLSFCKFLSFLTLYRKLFAR